MATEVREKFRVAAVIYCRDHHPEYTLRQMLEMAAFAQWLHDSRKAKASP
jgi:hypothetical protein